MNGLMGEGDNAFMATTREEEEEEVGVDTVVARLSFAKVAELEATEAAFKRSMVSVMCSEGKFILTI